ncbi:MAG TPA: ribonuclease HII [Stellaceae bacterium]|nr:ribonuclease HII [Stellaceae bacterium]
MPDFAWERRLGGMVAGVDEVGRGPLAGPVIAAAVILDPIALDAAADLADALVGLDDSKRLNAVTRRRQAAALNALVARRGAIIGIGGASVAEIDRLNILQASLLAMRRAVVALGVIPDAVLVDGNRAPRLTVPVTTLVGGDGISLSIAAASVIAKVLRDRLMVQLAGRHPGYGWERNAGYGTGEHLAALDRAGITAHHRLSFAPCREQAARRATGPVFAVEAPDLSPPL